MIVVADTSPLNYLVLIDQIHVLEVLYKRVAIPSSVHRELLDRDAPVKVQDWARHLPEWVEIHAVELCDRGVSETLDAGELEAITFALQVKSPTLIIDELDGRTEALKHGLTVIGTLGILREAGAMGLLNLRKSVEQLRQTNFRIATATLRKILPPE